MDELDLLWERAERETNPQARAVLWGECINYVLDLEDIREGLTFDAIRSMSDEEANFLALEMKDVFEMRRSPRSGISDDGHSAAETWSDQNMVTNTNAAATPGSITPRDRNMSTRTSWPTDVSRAILTKCHFRCCVCPQHRRVADIHHIDGDNSNSVEENGVALCKECHTDAHTTSTMQRNLQPEHLRQFKANWEERCESLAKSLAISGPRLGNVYYMSVHRLDALLRDIGEESVLVGIPHQQQSGPGAYDTLWANPKNPLNWSQLLDNRNHFEFRLNNALEKLSLIDLSLLEVGAVEAGAHTGGLVYFECQFIGHDIPDQNELIENEGRIEGPPPTMRRELIDPSGERVMETCMMLDSRYMYADSSFTQFSEDGVWSGIARLTRFREGVGSHDRHMLRDQIVLTPICICTPARNVQMEIVRSGNADPEQQYLRLLSGTKSP